MGSIFTSYKMGTVEENLRKIRQRVSDRAMASGRSPQDIRIVAVSKTFPSDAIREAVASEQIHFGENYAQEFKRKASELGDLGIKWHFIGHLQSNKAKEVVGKTHLIHSLDRISLAREIQKKADARDVTVDVLIEVHTTDEATKTGLPGEDVPDFIRSIQGYDRLRVRGLMTMGPFTDDPEDARPCFIALRQLQEKLRNEFRNGMTFDELSMGMTGDYGVAIEEGATIVRIGTAIFGQRTRHEE